MPRSAPPVMVVAGDVVLAVAVRRPHRRHRGSVLAHADRRRGSEHRRSVGGRRRRCHGCPNRYPRSAANIAVHSVRVPQNTSETITARSVGGSYPVGKSNIGTNQSELHGLPVDVDLLVVKRTGNIGEAAGQRLRDSPKTPVVGGSDGHRHPSTRRHRTWGEGPGGAGHLLSGHLNRYVGSAANSMVPSLSSSLSVPVKLWAIVAVTVSEAVTV